MPEVEDRSVQGERSVFKYFTDLKVLWEELEFLRPITSCTFKVKCKCNFRKTVIDYRDSHNLICFLKGLGDVYTNVKTQILLIEPLPNINRDFSSCISTK